MELLFSSRRPALAIQLQSCPYWHQCWCQLDKGLGNFTEIRKESPAVTVDSWGTSHLMNMQGLTIGGYL